MPGPNWRDDAPADAPLIAANVADLVRSLLAGAAARMTPTAAMAHDWHRAIYKGVAVPSTAYLGTPRGAAFPDIVDYEVVLREMRTGAVVAQGVPATEVAAELAWFERAVAEAVAKLDAALPPGSAAAGPRELLAVIDTAARAHGEWVRIHPYANGNGRTARVWANWVATRYGLPPFVRIKPRPDGLLYGAAAQASMKVPPDHSQTVALFLDLLTQLPRP